MALLSKVLKGTATLDESGKRAGGGAAGQGAGDAAERAKLEELARADLKRRLAAATRKQLKDKLDREKEVARINKSKVESAWLKILRLAKIDGLRRDAEVLAQSHEREVDRRDALLQLLDADLDGAEEQFQQAVRDHLRAVDRLVDIQDGRLRDLERSFRAELTATEEEFGSERRELEEAHAEEMALVKSVLVTVREREQARADRARAARDQRREEVRNEASDRMEELARTMNDRVRLLEREFESAHVDYLERTDTTAEKFKQMTAKDQQTMRAIRDFVAREQRLQSQLTATRAKLVSAARDFGERNASLSRERASMAAHVAALKRRMAASHKRWEARLTGLALAAGECKTELAARTELAERVLKLAERCRELETPEEKVTPFFAASDDDPVTGAPSGAAAAGLVPVRDGPGMEDPTGLRPGAAGPSRAAGDRDAGETARAGAASVAGDGEEEDGAPAGSPRAGGFASLVTPSWAASAAEVVGSGELESLELFFRRQNKALVEKVALEAERERLRLENETLASTLRSMLEGISLPEGALGEANPLLVVNGRSGVTAAAAAAAAGRSGGPTIIEAVDVARTTTKARAVGPRRG